MIQHDTKTTELINNYEQQVQKFAAQITANEEQIKLLTARLISHEANTRTQFHKQSQQTEAIKQELTSHMNRTIDKLETNIDSQNDMISKRFSHQTLKFENLEKCILNLTHAFNDFQTSMQLVQLPKVTRQFTVEGIRSGRPKPKLGINSTPTKSPPPKRTRPNKSNLTQTTDSMH